MKKKQAIALLLATVLAGTGTVMQCRKKSQKQKTIYSQPC